MELRSVAVVGSGSPGGGMAQVPAEYGVVAARGADWADGLPVPLDVPPERVAAALAGARRLVVLDDDPTGTQTVRDVPVLTRWGVDDIAWALEQDTPGFFVLTNTRSLSPEDAAQRNREAAEAALTAAARAGVDLVFASRSDSTLRGHFPLETDVLSAVLAAHDEPVDGVLLSPAYIDAGRVTLDGVHWLRSPSGLTPAGESEFARDATFGYRASRLSDWVEEKTGGRIPRAGVRLVTLPELRGSTGALQQALSSAREGGVLVVDAVTDDDLRATALAVVEAEAAGIRLIYRVGPSFVRARLGQGAHQPLTDSQLDELTGDGHGLIAIGSHVGLTTRQLDRLAARVDPALIEVDVERIVTGDAASHVDEVVARAATALSDAPVVVSTSRRLRLGATAADSLDVSRRVSAALTEAVRRIVAARRPAYVVAKGGITSSDIATHSLGIDRAMVRGSLLPGIVSLWQAESGPSLGLPYVVFAGNVGDDDALADVVERLEGR
ncbi:four-carbon acid sugar kinase family protein [Gryllotalpicola reticulitermitis]|uniref:Four-carbon acid sugar kinase family protein n=1 Tax=Gryllotalpicola reticulitermitis TaxID=1184153 RepID=A0ABV8Q6Y8_9MICO